MRSRNIKPGFFRNELLAECSFQARLLFAGLWCVADREGRLEDRRKRLKADIFPFDEADMDELIDELVDREFVGRYSVDGHNYLLVMNFKKHQSPHNTEKSSDIPPPTGEITVGSPLCHGAVTVTQRLGNDAHPLIPDSGFSDSGFSDSAAPREAAKRPKIGWTECDGFLNVTDKQREEWAGAFPACDITRQLKAAHNWLVANPAKRKKNYARFLNNWLTNAQEKGGDKPSVRATRPAYIAPAGGAPPPLSDEYRTSPASGLTPEQKREILQQATSEVRK